MCILLTESLVKKKKKGESIRYRQNHADSYIPCELTEFVTEFGIVLSCMSHRDLRLIYKNNIGRERKRERNVTSSMLSLEIVNF